MRAIIQRVSEANVKVQNKEVGKIANGFLILLGIEHQDNEEDADWLCSKILNMRLFEDENEKMNLSLSDVNGEVLVVSQFTLHASTKKGNRPSFIRSARPEQAKFLYNFFKNKLNDLINTEIQSGEFGAMMDVSLVNNGPVTIIIDSKSKE